MGSPSDQPLISVIIPTYNRADLITRALNSVIRQSYTNIEIIVVDDASRDDTETVVRALGDPRIVFFRQPTNGGAARARNKGVELAKGEYIAYLDSDDSWLEGKLERQLARVLESADPSNVVCYCPSVVDKGEGESVMPKRGMRAGERVADYITTEGGLIFTSTVFLSRRLALSAPFNPKYRVKEDWDVFLALDAKGVEWVYVDVPLSLRYAERGTARLSGTSSVAETLAWLDDHKKFFPGPSRHRFLVHAIVRPLIARGERRTYALKLIWLAAINGAISLPQAAMWTAKILAPRNLRKSAKRLLRG